MNKLMRFIPLLLLAVLFSTGCNKNSPKEVAENWLNAFNHLDFETAKKISTDDTKKLLSELEQLTSKVADSNKKELKKITVTIKNVKIDSNTAVATYVSTDNPGKDQIINLVKQNDKWLVRFSKVELMGGPGHTEEPAPVEGDNSAQADSLSNSSMDTTGKDNDE